jgi:hypothetical protein
MSIDEHYTDVTESDFNKKAFVLFVRALMTRLAAREGVVVDDRDGKTYIVWSRPEPEEIVITENEQNLPVGAFVWMDGDEDTRN